jgi:8-hydroxy-5-deazaflavin:NADPH oxidoreductase
MNVTIIGTGKMANAIATRLLEGGHNVYLIEHTPGKAKALTEELKSRKNGGNIEPAKPGSLPGEVVVLAVPYGAVKSVIRQYHDLLAGKILVDITNTFNFQKIEPLLVGDSAAEQIARLVPGNTKVVKHSIPCLPEQYLPER